jgi:hypothetical protein
MERGTSKNQNEPTLTAADVALLNTFFVNNEQFTAFEHRYTTDHENIENRFLEIHEKFEKRFTAVDNHIDAFETRMDAHMLAIAKTFLQHEERFDRIDSTLGILVRQMDIVIEGNKEFRKNMERLTMDSFIHEQKINNLAERVEVLEMKAA